MKNQDPGNFISKMRKLHFPNTFNPYVQRCERYDKPEAPQIRESILVDILQKACNTTIDAIWIARDLGHRGGRRTGLALTDDFRFSAHLSRWGLNENMPAPTHGPLVRARTATVVWEMLDQIEENIFLWNLFPLHPFPIGNTYRNRAHKAVERDAGIELLLSLISILRPRRIIAIGKDSAHALSNRRMGVEGVEVLEVRHPSYGGEKLFRRQIATYYNLQIDGCNSG